MDQPNQLVLTEAMAQKYFGQDNPIGQPIRVGSAEFLVSGIAANPPSNSHIQFKFFIPMRWLKNYARDNWGLENLDNSWLGGWMATYVKLSNANAHLATQDKVNQVVRQHSGSAQDSLKMAYVYHLQPMTSIHLKSNLRYDAPSNGSLARVYVFAAVGFIVLLLACINYMNLATASSLKRAKEMGIRKVSGAFKDQLIAQFLTESVLVSFLALLLGLGMFQLFAPCLLNLVAFILPCP